jgi:hypothetical protein
MKINQYLFTAAFILLTLYFIPCYSQCSDRMVMDFSGGKASTRRMWGPINYTRYKNYLKDWEYHSQPWVDMTDFREDEIRSYLSSNIKCLSEIDDDSLLSCFVQLRNKSNKDRVILFRHVFRQKKDTIPELISASLVRDPSSYMRLACADYLKYYSLNEAFESLKVLAEDSCLFVKVEAARTLAYLGEKSISYVTFQDIWKVNNPLINLDKFYYFTEGMRNIGNEEAIAFLAELTTNDNPYCALDASICFLQLKRKDKCLIGIRGVLKKENSSLFYIGATVLFKYYSVDLIISELEPYINDPDKNIAGYSGFLISSLKNKK